MLSQTSSSAEASASYSSNKTASELATSRLYEGNYNEWRPCIDKLLRSHELQHMLTEWQSAGAADLIAQHVQPAFLHRAIPYAARCDARRLLRLLQQHATPFRFFDLPPELRNRVYDLLLPEGTPTEISSRRPVITQASQQLRAETLPIYFAASRFVVDVNHKANVEQYTERVREWAKLTGPTQLKALCSVTLRVRLVKPGGPRGIKVVELARSDFVFKFAEDSGLSVTTPKGLDSGSKWTVEEHTRKIGEICKVVATEGGCAILLALSVDPELWMTGKLLKER
ncbi:hypothetical protein LTR08_004833 [Meristemomyces frigidus]|nr:hypothetical protein LTR08_004833 [Meristemomyces frigidus]